MSILLGKMVCRERVTTSGRSDREASLDESPNRPPITLGAGCWSAMITIDGFLSAKRVAVELL
jgi:hypothetical protein